MLPKNTTDKLDGENAKQEQTNWMNIKQDANSLPKSSKGKWRYLNMLADTIGVILLRHASRRAYSCFKMAALQASRLIINVAKFLFFKTLEQSYIKLIS